MSWSDWCESIKAGGFQAGGIYGLDGSPWAEFGQDTQYKFSGGDIPAVLKDMQRGVGGNADPVHVNGVKQQLLIATDDQLLGKKDQDSSVVAIKCNKCVMVGVGGQGSEPRKLLHPLSKVAESLKGNGY